MLKLMIFPLGLLLVTVAIQVSAEPISDDTIKNETPEIEETADIKEMTRSLLDIFGMGFLRGKCQERLTRVSSVLPNLAVTLTRLGNGRVYFFPPATATTTFQGAVTFCADHGMHLVTLNDETENSLVFFRASALGLTGAATNPGAWIGLRDVGNLNYKWIYDNAATSLMHFSVLPVAGRCANYIAGAVVTNPLLSWATTACNTATLSFICEMEKPCSLLLPSSQV